MNCETDYHCERYACDSPPQIDCGTLTSHCEDLVWPIRIKAGFSVQSVSSLQPVCRRSRIIGPMQRGAHICHGYFMSACQAPAPLPSIPKLAGARLCVLPIALQHPEIVRICADCVALSPVAFPDHRWQIHLEMTPVSGNVRPIFSLSPYKAPLNHGGSGVSSAPFCCLILYICFLHADVFASLFGA